MSDDKFSIGDILWEYADYTPPESPEKKAAPLPPTDKPIAPSQVSGQTGMSSPQPTAQPKPEQPQPANQPWSTGQSLPANQPPASSPSASIPERPKIPLQKQPAVGEPQTPAQGQPTQGQPKAPVQGQPTTGQPQAPAQGQPTAGQPQAPAQGQPTTGQPKAPVQGQPTTGQPQAPVQGQPTTGQPKAPVQGQPTTGQPKAPVQGQPTAGQPKAPAQGQPTAGQPQAPAQGQPTSGQPQVPVQGQPTTGQPKAPVQGQPTTGQPKAPVQGQPTAGQPKAPVQGQPTAGQPQAPAQPQPTAEQPKVPAQPQPTAGQPQAPAQPQPTTEQPKVPVQPQPTAGQPQAPAQPQPTAGQPQAPAQPQPTAGQPQAPAQPQPTTGQPKAPAQPQPTTGQPKAPAQPQPTAGQPQASAQEQPTDGQPQVPVQGQPTTGQPQAPAQGQPTTGQPQAPTQEQPTDGQPQVPAQEQPTDGQPQAPAQGQPTDGQPQVPAQGQATEEPPQTPPQTEDTQNDGTIQPADQEHTPPPDSPTDDETATPEGGIPSDDGPELIAFTPDPNATDQSTQSQESPPPGPTQPAKESKTTRQIPGPLSGSTQESTGFHPFRERKAKAEPPPPPDAAPSQLVEEYGPGLHALKGKCWASGLLCLPLLLLALMDSGIVPLLQGVLPENILLFASSGLFLVCVILCLDVLRDGLLQLINLAPNGDTLALFATLFTLADGATMIFTPLRASAIPFFAPCALVLAFHLLGQYCDRSAKFQAARVASSVSQPYLVTQDPNVLNGQPAFRKWMGPLKGFGSQLRTPSQAERRFQKLTPVLMTACICLALITTVAHHQPKLVIWSLSALFTAASTLGFSLSLNLPLRLFGGKLAKLGVALAGWPGLMAGKGCKSALLLDQDIYPPGTITLTGSRVFGSLSMERTVAFAASVIHASGSGLSYLFDKLLRAEGGNYLPIEKIVLQETGLIGQCQGQQILVGNSDFMSRQGIALPPGIRAKDAVFCAVSGELVGMFVLKYSLHTTIIPALQTLVSHRFSPIMVTRDFNLNPHRLRLWGRLPMDQLTFPDLQRRVTLSAPHQVHGTTTLAVLCREGVAPFSQAIIGAKRLRRAATFSSFFVNVGACVGVILTATLSSAGALSAMCAWHLALFLLLWLVPVLLIALWTLQY